ncbi:hypothetical protein EDC04DRAFT_2906667 [Pisolithus marmoratus]|nr:hypothetical protein EDC04DRAFT_2906667 [Pisolithus marmoratus]
MASSICIPAAALNDVAFALLEQYAQGKISDTITLTKIDVKLAVAGIPFDQEEWLDLMGIILMNPTDGFNSIKAVWQLEQTKTTPVLEDVAAWQLVLGWAASDELSFDDFLAQMKKKFEDRFKFDEWSSVFDEVFEASREGAAIAVEVVKAAMIKCGVLYRPSVHDLSAPQALSSASVSHAPLSHGASSSKAHKVSRGSDGPLPPAKHSRPSMSVRQFLDTSVQEEDENVDENDRDNKADHRPRVTQIDVGRTELRIFMIELPTAGAAAFVLKDLKGQRLHCRTFHSLPRRIFVEAGNPLEVQQSLPPLHSTLVKDIMQIPREELLSITQRCDIPVRSWVRILFGSFKDNIAYVLCIEDGSIITLVVPRSLPYHPDPQSPSNGWSIFDVDLARGHGLEVTVSTSDRGHPIAYCEGKEYYYGCSCIYFPMKWVKAVSMPSPDEIAWFSLASVDPPLVDRMLTRFSAQWWQDGDTSQRESVTVCVSTERSSDEVVEALEISVHDFKLEFPTGASVQVIAGLNCGFQGIVIGKVDDMYLDVPAIFLASHISLTTYISREPHNQLRDDPLTSQNRIQPGDFVRVTSGPHKGLCSMLHWYSSREILITPSTLQQADPDNLRDKGKSKAQEPKVPSGNGNIDEGSDTASISQFFFRKHAKKIEENDTLFSQVSVSMDEALIVPPSTLQFSRERGYDVTIGDRVRVVCGPAVDIEGLVHSVDFVSGHLTVLSDDGPLHDVLIGFCIKLENHSLRDVERQVGREVWIISGPKKGYRGTL